MDLNIARRKMIDCQIRPNDVTDESVIEAFESIAKEEFVPKAMRDLAYSEMELPTRGERRHWLARDLSKLLQAAEVAPTDFVLVIGAGEGYSAALLNEMADTVIGMESSEETVNRATEHMAALGLDRVAFVEGDLSKGLASEGPYDVIFVNGMVEYVPDAWLEQLSVGGRLAVVVSENGNGRARVYTKSEKSVSYHIEFECTPPMLSEMHAEKGFVF